MNKKFLKTVGILSILLILISSALIISKTSTYMAEEKYVSSIIAEESSPTISTPTEGSTKVEDIQKAEKEQKEQKALQITRIIAITVAVIFFASTTILFSVLRINKMKKDKVFEQKAKVEREIRDKREAERLKNEMK